VGCEGGAVLGTDFGGVFGKYSTPFLPQPANKNATHTIKKNRSKKFCMEKPLKSRAV